MGRYEQVVKALQKAFRINQDGELEPRRAMFPINRDYLIQVDDFEGAVLDAYNWVVLTEDNGSACAIDLNAMGRIILTTGTDDDGLAALFGGIQWSGANNVEFICRIITSATITTTKMEFGLTDSGADNGAWGTLAEDGSGDTADDCVIFIWDKDKDDTALYAAGSNGTAGWGGVDLSVDIEASTTYEFKIKIATQVATMYYKKIGTHTKWQLLYTKAAAVTAATLLTPWIFIQARANAASRSAYCDWVYLRQAKA